MSTEQLIESSPLLSHIHKSYPLANEVSAYLVSFSLVSTIVSLSAKYLTRARSLSDTYAPSINKADAYIESTVTKYVFINGIDTYLPTLQTIHLSDFTLKNLYATLLARIQATIIYAKFFELVNKTLQAVNPKLDTLTGVSHDASTSEIDKFIESSLELFVLLKAFPFKVQSHVLSVYNDEVSKNNNSQIKAIASTSNELASEISSKLSSQFKTATATAKQATESVEQVVKEKAPAIANAVTTGFETASVKSQAIATEITANGKLTAASA